MAIANVTTLIHTITTPVPISSPESSSLGPIKGVQNSNLAPGIREEDLPKGIRLPDPVHGKFIAKLLGEKQKLEHLKDEHEMRSRQVLIVQTDEEIENIHTEFEALSTEDFKAAIEYDASLKTDAERKSLLIQRHYSDISNKVAETTNKWPFFLLCKNEGSLSKNITIECKDYFTKKMTSMTRICPAKGSLLVNIQKIHGDITFIEKTGSRGTETTRSFKGGSFGAQLGAKFEQINSPNTFDSLKEIVSHISTTLSDDQNWNDLLSFSEFLLEGFKKRDNPSMYSQYKELKEQALTGLRSIELLKEKRNQEL